MTPRGIRNNNPGNLIYDPSVPWEGQTGPDSAGYAVFSSPMYGIRAMGHQLMDYYSRGLVTVEQIISTWAPPTTNDTQAYVADVCQRMGVGPAEPLNLPAQLPQLAAAIIWHENGEQPYSMADVSAWVTMQ